MRTACSTSFESMSVVLRRSLLLAGFLLGCGVVALVSAGPAHADGQEDRSSRSSEARGGSGSGGGLLGGLMAPVVSSVSEVAAPVVEPVVGLVEPVTAPLLRPVTEPLSPLLEVLAPVTEPLLDPAEPVVTPVAQGLGVEPWALGVDPTRAVPGAPAPVGSAPGVDVTVPAVTSLQVAPPATVAPVAVEAIGPLWTTVMPRPTMSNATADAAGSRWHGRPARGPVSPRPDLAVLAGATGTASSGGNAGGAPGQADLPGQQGFGSHDGVQVVPVQRWLVPPWCYVFGRHHPS